MSEVKLILPEQSDLSPREYVEQKLVPITAELNRLCQELFVPGISAEAGDIDMTTADNFKYYTNIDSRIEQLACKSVKFSCHPDIPVVKGDKRLKILLSAVVYVVGQGCGIFRMVRSCDGEFIYNSEFQIRNTEPITVNRYLPFGSEKEKKKDYNTNAYKVSPFLHEYHFQAKWSGVRCKPVLRRFSLSTVYV
jgi:hypothetical protein